jgi:PAS domain S-box-containing protein
MPAPPLPQNEHERRAAVLALNILDRKDGLDFTAFPEMAAQALAAPISAISLVEADRQWFMASVGLAVSETPRSSSFCAHAILKPGEVLHVPDATQDIRFADNPLVVGTCGFRAYAGAPIIGPTGHALGAICVIDTQPREFSPDALTKLTDLARGIGSALRLHNGLEDLRKQESERALLQTMLAAIFQKADQPVLIVRASGAILLGNEAYQLMTGFAAEALPTLSVQDLLAPEHQAMAGAALAQQVATGEPYKIDTVVLHKDGSRIPVHMNAAVIQRSDTQLFRVLTMRPVVSVAASWSSVRNSAMDLQPPHGRLPAVSPRKNYEHHTQLFSE